LDGEHTGLTPAVVDVAGSEEEEEAADLWRPGDDDAPTGPFEENFSGEWARSRDSQSMMSLAVLRNRACSSSVTKDILVGFPAMMRRRAAPPFSFPFFQSEADRGKPVTRKKMGVTHSTRGNI
jgi:hypothetical protein